MRLRSIHPYLGMSPPILRFAAYAIAGIAALASAVLFSLLRHRFRQRGLQKIPGPSNPSLIWGKTHIAQRKVGRMLSGIL